MMRVMLIGPRVPRVHGLASRSWHGMIDDGRRLELLPVATGAAAQRFRCQIGDAGRDLGAVAAAGAADRPVVRQRQRHVRNIVRDVGASRRCLVYGRRARLA